MRSRARTRIGSAALLVAVFTVSADAVYADSAVILGAGQIGSWFMSAYVSNPNASQTAVTVSPSPFFVKPVPCEPTQICPNYNVPIDAQGSASLPYGFDGFQFGTLYVTPPTADAALPIVQASLTDEGGSCRATVGIPVIPLSKLIAANLSMLDFPRVTPEGPGLGVSTNLILGNIQRNDGLPGEELPVFIQLLDSQGQVAGSTALIIPYGVTLVFGDVSAISDQPGFVPNGHVRVTRVSGNALLWGILYTVDPQFGVTTSTGVNLSP
jgi:hypothetical protein